MVVAAEEGFAVLALLVAERLQHPRHPLATLDVGVGVGVMGGVGWGDET